MSWKDKALALHKRFGAPAKFAAKMVLGAVLPGSPAVVELVCGVLDCVHETTKDHLEFDAANMRSASAADLQRVEQVLDVLNGDLAALMAQLAHLEQVPDIARQMLDTALATDERCRKAAHRLDELARRFDRLEEQNRRLLSGQGYAADMLEELLPLMRRVVGVVDFVEELCEAGLQLADFRGRLHAFQDGANALGLGRIVEAEPLLLDLAQAQPRSGATAKTEKVSETFSDRKRFLTPFLNIGLYGQISGSGQLRIRMDATDMGSVPEFGRKFNILKK